MNCLLGRMTPNSYSCSPYFRCLKVENVRLSLCTSWVVKEPISTVHQNLFRNLSCQAFPGKQAYKNNHELHCLQTKFWRGGALNLLQHSSKCSTAVSLVALFCTACRRISSSCFCFSRRFSCSRNFGRCRT